MTQRTVLLNELLNIIQLVCAEFSLLEEEVD